MQERKRKPPLPSSSRIKPAVFLHSYFFHSTSEWTREVLWVALATQSKYLQKQQLVTSRKLSEVWNRVTVWLAVPDLVNILRIVLLVLPFGNHRG